MTYTLENPKDTFDPTKWTLGGAQLVWLQNTLENSDAKWKFVLGHHPVAGQANTLTATAYGRGGGRAAHIGEQETVHQLMIDNDVTAFFYGHDHTFFDMVVDGIHYLVPGCAGAESLLYFAGRSGYVETGLPYYEVLGYTTVEVKTDKLIVTYKDQSGTVLDSFEIYQKDSGDTTTPTVDHTPITSSGVSDIIIDATVTDNEEIENVMLYHKLTTEEDYDFHIHQMTDPEPDNTYTATISSLDFTDDTEYYIHAEDINGNVFDTPRYTITFMPL
jgi:hypothetical protein